MKLRDNFIQSGVKIRNKFYKGSVRHVLKATKYWRNQRSKIHVYCI